MLTDDAQRRMDDGQRTTHDDHRRPIAISHLSDSADLKEIITKRTTKKKQPQKQQTVLVEVVHHPSLVGVGGINKKKTTTNKQQQTVFVRVVHHPSLAGVGGPHGGVVQVVTGSVRRAVYDAGVTPRLHERTGLGHLPPPRFHKTGVALQLGKCHASPIQRILCVTFKMVYR